MDVWKWLWPTFVLVLPCVTFAKPSYLPKDPLYKTSVFNEDYDLPLVPVDGPAPAPRHEKWMLWKPSVASSKKAAEAFNAEPQPTLPDPCSAVFCRLGRVCAVGETGHGECVCADSSYCEGHHKKVCGTDGEYYPSHCELHRTACVRRVHIGIDHTEDGCRTLPQPDEPVTDASEVEETETVESTGSMTDTEPSKESGSTEEAMSLEEDSAFEEVILPDIVKKNGEQEQVEVSTEASGQDTQEQERQEEQREEDAVEDDQDEDDMDDEEEAELDADDDDDEEDEESSEEELTDSEEELSTEEDLTEEEEDDEVSDEEEVVGDDMEDDDSDEEVDASDESDESYDWTSEEVVQCTGFEYDRFKESLLQYHCGRIGENDCTEDHSRKQFVANVMFSYYDRNGDDLLNKEELDNIQQRDNLERLSRFCQLTNMLDFDDKEEDGNISLTEFYAAFRIPTVILDDNLRIFNTVVKVGGSVEMKCDVKGSDDIMWRRNGGALDDLTNDDLKVFEDGSLYIKNLALQHAGNYTCQDPHNDRVVQTHVLTVHMAPRVRVSPTTQFHTSGASVVLRCHAEGIPEPVISWEMNEVALPQGDNDPERHYLLLHNNSTLEIAQAMYTRDTGAYKCKAQNQAGSAQDIATVFIESSNVPPYATELHETFVVFHTQGYTVYEPTHCNVVHMVLGTNQGFPIMPEYSTTPRTLCGPEDTLCSWGDAVNVQDKFIYVTQPGLNRVVIIEARGHSNPIEVIATDKVPVSIQYVEHLDQVWLVCWNNEEEGLEGGAKTVLVIRQASEDITHHTVHTQPIANHFDLVKDIFLPPTNDHQQTFYYGYITHNEQQALFKIDLKRMEYVKNIDLAQYACVPQSVAFLPLGGRVVVHCSAPDGYPQKSTRLVMDYITDRVLQQSTLSGEPHVSPDGRHMVTVESAGNTLSAYRISEDGEMEHQFDEYTTLEISDVTFFPSESGRGYDMFASASNRNDVLYINLNSGKVEMIEGVGEALGRDEWSWSSQNRVISSGGLFSQFLISPSRDSIVVLSGKRRHVQCEWQNIQRGNVVVWVEPQHL